MPTIITHSIVSVLLGKTIKWEQTQSITICSLFCGSLPDLDVVGHSFGIAYLDHWGHRGLSHSLVAAIGIGFVLSLLCSQRSLWACLGWSAYFAALTCTHGLLDMLTNGGYGVAILAPWSHRRYFFSDDLRVIEVSPLNFHRFTWEYLAPVFKSEFLWIILPIFTLFIMRYTFERWRLYLGVRKDVI